MTTRDHNDIRTLEELLQHAQRIERDAALRYAALAEQMDVHNNPELAAVFRKMAVLEQMHVDDIDGLCRELDIPAERVASRWKGLEAGEAPDFTELHYLARPWHMLKLAMKYEKQNADFYGRLSRSAEIRVVREVAARLQKEEIQHLAELEKWIGRYPEPDADWDQDMDPPGELE